MDKRNSKSDDNKERIQKLIASKQLILPTCPKLDSFINREIGENALVGELCGAIVVAKDELKKQLNLHIIVIYDGPGVINISGNKYTAFMKDFQLKADSSIFTYLNGFKDIETGTYINAWVRRIEKRELTTQGLKSSKVNPLFFKNTMEMVLNRQMGMNRSDVRVGVVKDHIRIPQSIMKVYEKEGTFPLNFQMLFMKHFDNPGMIDTLLRSLKVEPIGSMHPISNIENMKKFDYDYQRIRFQQETNWRDQHLAEGIEHLKNGKNDAALECFNIAMKFNHNNVEIYIAKAIALYNIKNTAEALKQIKQALKIDPTHERARNYYEQFRAELTEKPDSLKKRVNASGYDLVHRK